MDMEVDLTEMADSSPADINLMNVTDYGSRIPDSDDDEQEPIPFDWSDIPDATEATCIVGAAAEDIWNHAKKEIKFIRG